MVTTGLLDEQDAYAYLCQVLTQRNLHNRYVHVGGFIGIMYVPRESPLACACLSIIKVGTKSKHIVCLRSCRRAMTPVDAARLRAIEVDQIAP